MLQEHRSMPRNLWHRMQQNGTSRPSISVTGSLGYGAFDGVNCIQICGIIMMKRFAIMLKERRGTKLVVFMLYNDVRHGSRTWCKGEPLFTLSYARADRLGPYWTPQVQVVNSPEASICLDLSDSWRTRASRIIHLFHQLLNSLPNTWENNDNY